MPDKTTEQFERETDGETIVEADTESNNSKHEIFHKQKLLALGVIGAVLIFSIIAAVFLFQKKPVQASSQPPEVEVTEVVQQDVPIYSQWTGTTDGMVNSEIRAQVSGYLL